MKNNFFPLLIFLILFQLSTAQNKLELPALVSNNMVLQQSSEISIWGWAAKNKTIEISPSWTPTVFSVKSNKEGKWKTKIKTPSAGGPFTIQLKSNKESIELKNVMVGEVWLASGQSNMQMPLKGYGSEPINSNNELILHSKNSNIRMFTVKRNSSIQPAEDCIGSWQEANPENTPNFSAVAYVFAQKINRVLDIPVGIIHSSWGGTPVEAWTQKEAMERVVTAEEKNTFRYNQVKNKREQDAPSQLFNGMIHPLLNYKIKGAIWYQGESNRNHPKVYQKTFPLMIQNWRQLWNNDLMPFYYVQIAPYGRYSGPINSALLRETQLKTMDLLDGVGMAVTLDIGEYQSIHPAEKIKVGERLSYWALAKDYNIQGIQFSGPVYKSHEVEGSKIQVSFDHAPMGLSTYRLPLNNFEIAGKDRVFYPAKAKILRNGIVEVHSEKVKTPVAVRYGWNNFLTGTLFNTYGLPASSFRTDNWEDSKNAPLEPNE
ncbi:MAG: sialate O-acetylesterase [Flavobacteriaceae bacterium]